MDGVMSAALPVTDDRERTDEALALIERARLLLTQAICRLGSADGKAGAQIAHALATETGYAIERARDGVRSRRKQGAGEEFLSICVHETCIREPAKKWSWCLFTATGTRSGLAPAYDKAMADAVAAADAAQGLL